jgi:ankyrin repeat domain-containing protein 50
MQTLDSFPEKIEDVYRQTYQRILDSEPHQSSQAQRAFIWVLNAKQPMAIDQLRHALATCPITHRFEPARLMSEAALVSVCRGLIVVDKESQLVRLVRKSSSHNFPPLFRLMRDKHRLHCQTALRTALGQFLLPPPFTPNHGLREAP